MAYTLKTGKTYTDPHGGSHSSAYAVFYQINGNSRNNRKDKNLTLEIFRTEAGAKNGEAPYENHSFTVKNEGDNTHYDDYFSTTELSKLNKNPKKGAYSYLDMVMQAEIDDEVNKHNGVRGGFKWEDWETDEKG